MAKSKNQPQVEEHDGFSYETVAKVRVPTMKIPDGEPVFIKALDAIATKPTTVKGEDGVVRIKEIDTLRVCNLKTGEVCEIVVGAALRQTLADYKGGNGAYVGLCFRIVKRSAPAGKRWKAYEVDEISVKGE